MVAVVAVPASMLSGSMTAVYLLVGYVLKSPAQQGRSQKPMLTAGQVFGFWTSLPGNGIDFSPRRRMCYALGFLRAAPRILLRDLTAPLWRGWG
ncbi:hypothetical protein JHN63_21905 [Streptomyces sp. MBT65]|uniref:hypothetical protein n=1 Tax=Streptomyces sp. MBT65 TaxID=1488395 RepID=UPI0019093EEA|nr:hypothetical protein [Streptomyces sp. MBT65]MBK3576419.1 hypothetical protein [Streptomyces sp. MBT65]